MSCRVPRLPQMRRVAVFVVPIHYLCSVMKIRENKFNYSGPQPIWLLPEVLLSCDKYSEDYVEVNEYRWFFQIEVVWIFFGWTLWIEFGKKRK